MIGVAVQPSEQPAARELFELCKTVWEFAQPDRHYEVLLCTALPSSWKNCRLILCFGTAVPALDVEPDFQPSGQKKDTVALHAGQRVPLYGSAVTFPASPLRLVTEESSQQPLLSASRRGGCTIIRIGYNLFDEIHRLLTTGQPRAHAGIPTLDLHLALLRDLITRAGLPLIEIPPVPAGHAFMACLSHDIDHPVLRNHRWDHTMFGFLQRATIGAAKDFLRGRMPVGALLKNWGAVLRLPLIHLGWARDFWRDFARDYLVIEAGLGATYFFITERDNPGRKADGSSAPMRACRYTLAELKPQIEAIMAVGNEVGVHGLDAWRDVDAGRTEMARIAHLTGKKEIGIRMHWLYFGPDSPAVLDQAGYTYDSTVGYNETVGYRAGTTQVFQPPGTTRLLELPLHVMDTALFYPRYLHLDEATAFDRVGAMISRTAASGGVLTYNWHDRSLFPDRLWGNVYRRLIQEMKDRHAWFPTAAEAVAWFRQRRQARLELIRDQSGKLSVRGQLDKPDKLPGLIIRIHRPLPRAAHEVLATGSTATFYDERFDKIMEVNLHCAHE